MFLKSQTERKRIQLKDVKTSLFANCLAKNGSVLSFLILGMVGGIFSFIFLVQGTSSLYAQDSNYPSTYADFFTLQTDLTDEVCDASDFSAEDGEDSLWTWSNAGGTPVYRRALFNGDSAVIRGQSSSSYWSTVQDPYLVAQADTAPSLDTSNVVTTQAASSVAPPLDSSAGTLTPSSGSIAPPAPTDPNPSFFEEPVQTMKRFWEGNSISYTFIPKNGDEGLSLHDFDFKMQFNFPCKCMPHANQEGGSGYWYISPEFGLQLWNQPDIPRVAKMNSQTFDAALAFGAKPQFTKDFGADLCVQLGLASSFKKVSKDSFFIRGRGLGTLRINDQITAIGGVIYYDRNRYKLLPSGGVKWVPNEKNEWLLVFPNPRLSRYLANLNDTKWWGYIQGDIGGGHWLIQDDDYGTLEVDYNDYRLGVGALFECPSGFKGFVEVGGAFGRELYYWGDAQYKPKTAVYLKGGIAY